MIRYLDAISFDRILTGGTTLPWLVMAQDGANIYPYVAKLYTRPAPNYNPKLNEVLCSVLAPHFDLIVPDWGFIKFTDQFINELPSELRLQLKRKDFRYNFSTLQIEGNFPFTDVEALDKKSHNLEMIFAFDCLTQNRDRRLDKPNILFKGHIAYLIDHEKTFLIPETKTTTETYNYNETGHIFYSYIKKLYKPQKLKLIENFVSKLNSLNLNIVEGAVDNLRSNGFDTEGYEIILEYLENIVGNSDRFGKLLLSKIS